MAALVDAPTVVFPCAHEVHCLPQILPVVAHPDVTGQRIHGQPPWVAQAVGIQLAPRVGEIDERVVRGDAIRLVLARFADVYAQHAAEQVVQRLAGNPVVGVACAVAGRDVEHAIQSEGDPSAVMPSGAPFDD